MERGACNVCGSTGYDHLIDLGKHPLADTFLPEARRFEPEIYYPLALAECRDCGHVFTRYYIPAAKRYVESEYSYDSSNSPVAEAHFKEFAGDIVDTYAAFFGRPPTMAIDIGSNVGTLLGYLQVDAGVQVLGVEPSPNISALAIERGVPTICALFDRGLLELGQFAGRPVSVIASTNVVNHMDDLAQMMEVIEAIAAPDGLFAFEVPYLVDLLEQTAFDTAYHEHVNYFSIRSVCRLLDRHGFRAARIDKIEYMGGSIRVFAVRKSASVRLPDESLTGIVEAERAYFAAHSDWQEAFRARARNIKSSLLAFVHAARSAGKTICAIGAATKGNTLLNYCRLDRDAIPVCCDVSKLKVGKVMPGSGIPIVHDKDLGDEWDYAIVLPWNLSGYLMDKFHKSGISLVFPIQGRIIHKDGSIETLV